MLCCDALHLNFECYVYKPNNGNGDIYLSTKKNFSKVEFTSPSDMSGAHSPVRKG